MRNKPMVLPVFLAHGGCPFRCAFCNQESSVGHTADPLLQIEKVLSTLSDKRKAGPVELAFYGGDFARLEKPEQQKLLNAVFAHKNAPLLSGLRASVRPDSITDSVARDLKGARFSTIEIGAQCLDDAVLERIHRGHSAADCVTAAKAAKNAGLFFGFQLMIGLPGQSVLTMDESNKKAAACEPDFVRIFPAVVLKDTAFEQWYNKGEYTPLELEQGIDITARALAYFIAMGILVLQIGLHPSEPLVTGRSFVAGSFDPNMGEKVRGRLWQYAAMQAIEDCNDGDKVLLRIHPAEYSQLVGKKRSGLTFLENRYSLRRIDAEPSTDVARGTVTARKTTGQATAATRDLWATHYFGRV